MRKRGSAADRSEQAALPGAEGRPLAGPPIPGGPAAPRTRTGEGAAPPREAGNRLAICGGSGRRWQFAATTTATATAPRPRGPSGGDLGAVLRMTSSVSARPRPARAACAAPGWAAPPSGLAPRPAPDGRPAPPRPEPRAPGPGPPACAAPRRATLGREAARPGPAGERGGSVRAPAAASGGGDTGRVGDGTAARRGGQGRSGAGRLRGRPAQVGSRAAETRRCGAGSGPNGFAAPPVTRRTG